VTTGVEIKPLLRGSTVTVEPPTFTPSDLQSLPVDVGHGFVEALVFGDRLMMALGRYRLTAASETLVYGEDMVKFHVRLSGRRLLTFGRRAAMTLDEASTCALVHEAGLPKMDHVLPDHEEASVTIAMPRPRFVEYLDATGSGTPQLLGQMLTHYSHGPRFASAAPTRTETQLAREILDCRRVGPRRRLFLEAKTLELVCCILDHFSASPEQPAASVRLTGSDRRRLQQVRELLEASFMEPIRIEDLTRQFGLNRNKLCTGFRHLFGVSIFDFACGLKMDQAWRLLRESQLSVSEIALNVGYSSSAAFSAAFHRHFGNSPSDIRRAQS